MSNHIADASKMVDTPRTDAKRSGENHFMGDWVDANFARQLERELNAANEHIKRLEEAGGQLMMWLGGDISASNRQLLEDHWNKAKEAKP